MFKNENQSITTEEMLVHVPTSHDKALHMRSFPIRSEFAGCYGFHKHTHTNTHSHGAKVPTIALYSPLMCRAISGRRGARTSWQVCTNDDEKAKDDGGSGFARVSPLAVQRLWVSRLLAHSPLESL